MMMVEEIENLIAKRQAALKRGDTEKADQIEVDLAKLDVVVSDEASGTKWKRVLA